MTTNYLKLKLTAESEVQMTFLEWRTLMNGVGADSNMNLIDSAIKQLNKAVEKRADGLILDTDTGVLQLTSGGVALPGASVVVDVGVDELKSAFDTEEHKSLNLLDPSKIIQGYYWTDGWHDSGNYNSTPYITVAAGQRLWLQYGLEKAASRQKATMMFITGYNAEKQRVAGTEQRDKYSYVVPDGVAFVIVSTFSNLLTANQLPVILDQEEDVIQDYIPYFETHTVQTLKNESNSPQTVQNTADIEIIKDQIAAGHKSLIFTATAESLAANTNLICCNSCDNKKNEYIEFFANFSSFETLTIAHGKDSYGGGYITIDATKIKVYTYNGTLVEEFEHGLTEANNKSISDFLSVTIYTKNNSECRSKISIMSAKGSYTAETTRYYSSRAAVLCNATFAMTNVKMQYTVNDAKESVWVFGDSYVSMGDPNRWATQAVQEGHTKMMIHGFGGAMSMNEIVPFRALLNVARPKFIVWCLGMNDGDSDSAVNTNWKTCVDEVIATCEAKGITPILATIPNVPNIRNTFKNDYVKSIGCRYVDFAKAVNAESAGATWYAGMLSSDNTHPTALGAKALMRQFLLDVPETLYAEE